MSPKRQNHFTYRVWGAVLVVGAAHPAAAGVVAASPVLWAPWGALGRRRRRTPPQRQHLERININKPVTINKSIEINKGSVSGALAGAPAGAAVGAAMAVYGGSYVEESVDNGGGEVGIFPAAETCEVQEATVVKAIHTVCVAEKGRSSRLPIRSVKVGSSRPTKERSPTAFPVP